MNNIDILDRLDRATEKTIQQLENINNSLNTIFQLSKRAVELSNKTGFPAEMTFRLLLANFKKEA